jgi:hypothetical protein
MSFKRSDYANMTVAELKELLRADGLATSGKKEELVDRLVDAYNEQIRDLYRSMAIAELKELLRASGLPLSGKKEDLVERLFETSLNRIIDDRLTVEYGFSESYYYTSVAPPMASTTARVSLPLELLPDNEFIVKDWGINPYDPPASFQGFDALSEKEQKRLLKALAESPRNSAANADPYARPDYMAPTANLPLFMGVLYFNDWSYFYGDWRKLSAFVESYSQPSTIMNWNTEQFVTMVRRTGGLNILARFPFGKEDSV